MAGRSTKREWTPIVLLIDLAILMGLFVAWLWGLDWRWPISAVAASIALVVVFGYIDERRKIQPPDDDLLDYFHELGDKAQINVATPLPKDWQAGTGRSWPSSEKRDQA